MVGIRKIEALITAMNDGDATGLKSRLQYLNAHHFPPGFRVGKAKRADYGMDEVLAFSLWFSLTQASLTPIAATALVSDFWPELARLYLTAAAQAGVPEVAMGRSEATIGVFTGNALRSAAKVAPDDLRGPAAPFDVRSATRDSLAHDLGGGFDARIVIDFSAVHAAIASAMPREPHPLDEGRLDAAIASFAMREGWSPDIANTGRAGPPEIRPLHIDTRGQRLGEADYYFHRAIEFVDEVEHHGAGRLAAAPRLIRIVNYLIDPSPREEWKRWVQAAESDIAFIWAIGALADRATDIDMHLPVTVLSSAAERIAGGDVDRLSAVIRSTALKARNYEPVVKHRAQTEP